MPNIVLSPPHFDDVTIVDGIEIHPDNRGGILRLTKARPHQMYYITLEGKYVVTLLADDWGNASVYVDLSHLKSVRTYRFEASIYKDAVVGSTEIACNRAFDIRINKPKIVPKWLADRIREAKRQYRSWYSRTLDP